jgi:hypothetical protein
MGGLVHANVTPGTREDTVTDEKPQPYLWARTQVTLESIAASYRVLARSEATLHRARAAVVRADAVLERIYKLCARIAVAEYGGVSPPRTSRSR